mmetsp:Transcript_10531/g.28830  ORF Transcript_10531/g.28830 Transcript_10531/m.28830 type:complete len:247 (+) Transcript_10531:170-910(+)|eukprot:CAMPEP_0202342950 /NCGR_PEP_ID=MMETSP1126-20121109/3292_1 /ASSEMBLY_ACC=CAM_ASM_000457 /TAXON_ID=3047 /ORGANISM="Dunaliella tertiolecta, Strain CCMP1320" /LENGTH=246 /DNA_ID=CAMNT_0048933973 /DNA_START=81 /DNA_END=821 /DNA_ORIENTATION=-
MPPWVPGTVTAASLRREEPLWREADQKAQKKGPHHTVYWTSGERYQGEWFDNKRQGKGTVIYKNNDKYEGEWAYGLRHGLGTLWIYKNGKYIVRYNGEWSEDAPTGHGTVFEDNGDTYEGDFLYGQKHGRGRAVYGGRPIDGFGGDVYEGHFENDLKNGPGTMMYANGDVFEGLWQNDLKHGPGTYFYINRGKRFDGVWQEGVGKAGSYSEIHTPPAGTPGSLPPVELKKSDAVLQAATDGVMQQL